MGKTPAEFVRIAQCKLLPNNQPLEPVDPPFSLFQVDRVSREVTMHDAPTALVEILVNQSEGGSFNKVMTRRLTVSNCST